MLGILCISIPWSLISYTFFYLPLFKLCFYTLKLWFQGQQWVMAWDTSPLPSRIVSSREGSTFKEKTANQL